MKENDHAIEKGEVAGDDRLEHQRNGSIGPSAAAGDCGVIESSPQIGGEDSEEGIQRPPQTLGEERNLTPVTLPGVITEENIRSALTEAKGDLYVAACLLETTAWRLDRLIRCNAGLQAFTAAIYTVKADPKYDRMSQGQFAQELHRLTAQFAVEGLLVIHEIASSPARTAAEKAVRLEAAIALRNGSSIARGGSEIDLLLQELNQAYQAHAPRIKEIRTTTVVLEDSRQIESLPLTIAPSRD